MENKSLYKIEQDYLDIISQVQESEGELTPELESALIINKSELNQKSIAYINVIKEKENYNSLIDNEIKRLQSMKKSNEALVSRLKHNLLEAVKLFGEFSVGFHTFKTRKSTSIEVEEVNSLPKEYKTVKIVETADKIALKKALSEGVEIKGVSLVINENLSIK